MSPPPTATLLGDTRLHARLTLPGLSKIPMTQFEEALISNGVAVDLPATEGDYFEVSAAKLTGAGDFRAKFLRKLAYNQVWLPKAQRPPRHQTVIIFDWDDTLLCTTWLNRYQHRTIPAPLAQQLRTIGRRAVELLEAAVLNGNTFIITNAMTGWVEQSAQRWVPELLPVLKKVRVISARDTYEFLYPDDVDQWKTQAFLEVQRELDAAVVTNLVVIGDSKFEMDAAQVMGKQFEEAFTKTIKLRPTPTPVEHLKQLDLVAEKFDKIVSAARSMKIFLERK